MPINALDAMTAFDVMLLVLSLLIALSLHPAGLSVSERVAGTGGRASWMWLAAGALALALGASALGLTAALAVRSTVPRSYPLMTGLTALALAISATAFALMMLRLNRPLWQRAVGGGIVWGASLAVAGYLDLTALGWSNAFTGNLRLSAEFIAAAAVGGVLVLGSALLVNESDQWRRSALAVGTMAVVGAVPAAYYMALLSTRGTPPPADGAPTGWFIPFGEDVVLGLAGAAVLLQVAMIYAAGVDLRLRRRRDETEVLRRSEDRFRSLTQASSQIVWTTAPSGEMVGDQPSWSGFTGQKASAYRGWGWFNAIHPEDRQATASIWEESLANRRSVEVQHRLRRDDGQYRDCVARVVPVLEPDGNVREWVGTHTDVTERARMHEERELLAGAGRVLSSSLDERETLGAIAGLLVPGVADWCTIDVRSADGGLERVVATHVDSHRATLLQEMSSDFAGHEGERGVARVLATGESELIREVNDEALQALAPDEAQLRRLRAVGVASLISVPLITRTQTLGVLTLALVDAGAPYDLRDLALAEELARRSAIAIDNSRLYSASRAAIRARDEVMSIVSHDLRNSLSTITMTADLLLQLPMGPEEQRHHLEVIQRSGAAMNRLIRDLLEVSRTDSDRLAMELVPVEPAAIVKEAWEAVRPLAADKKQRLTCEVPRELPLINADAARVQQVLSNLLGNAVKFVDEGGSIRVAAAAAAGEVQFSVVDNGPGIPPEDLPRVFDRHWRARETAHLGAGLGLAISKAIVEAHGGRIWAESEPGRGTGFHFTVPAVSAPAAAPERQPAQPGTSPDQSPVEAVAADS